MKPPWWSRLWWYNRLWRRGIDQYLETHSPDVIVSNMRCHVPTIQGARGHDVPVVAIIEGLGFMRYNPQNLRLDKRPRFFELPFGLKIQYPFVRSLYHQQCAAFPEFGEIIALSEFLGDVVEASFGVDTQVIRTMVDLEAVTATDHQPEYVTMVNPRSKLKGPDIFLDIVRELPEQQFLVAGDFATESQRKAAEELDNLTYLGWVDDMREVYRQTELLVVPSLAEEGGPRVIVEAFANGIPVVGTDRGGVPEFIGEAGAIVDDPHDTGEWIEKIEVTRKEYDRKQTLARERAPMFDSASPIDQYEQLLEEIVRRKS
jgi:glycosyltransferase involved in cell wall biosynthesis